MSLDKTWNHKVGVFLFQYHKYLSWQGFQINLYKNMMSQLLRHSDIDVSSKTDIYSIYIYICNTVQITDKLTKPQTHFVPYWNNNKTHTRLRKMGSTFHYALNPYIYIVCIYLSSHIDAAGPLLQIVHVYRQNMKLAKPNGPH